MELGQRMQVRWVRSLLVAALTSCSAGLAHTAGGGHRAPVLLLVCLTAVGTPIMHVLSSRRWRFTQLVAVMALAQLALHAAMATFMSGSMPMAHGASAAGQLTSDGTSGAMAASHIGMTLFFAAVLAYGEKMLAWTLRVLVPHLASAPFGDFTVRRATFDVMSAPRLVDVRQPCASRAPPTSVALSH